MAGTCNLYRYGNYLFGSRKRLSVESFEYYDNRDYAVAKLQWKVPQIRKKTRLICTVKQEE